MLPINNEHNSYTVKEIINLSSNISEVVLSPNDQPIIFVPGQYINVYLDKDSIKNSYYCSYSIASIPQDSRLRIIVSHGKNNAKINYFTQNLDSTIYLSNANGQAYYRNSTHNKNIIALSLGTGIAPIKSIIDYNNTLGSGDKFFLYYVIKSKEDMIFSEHFNVLKKKMNLSCIILVLNYNYSILYDLLLNNKSILTQSDFYVFGSDKFVSDIRSKLLIYCNNGQSQFFSDI